MAARCCGRLYGWGLPALILGTLFGAFSTMLNGMQTLNGLFCFDTVRSSFKVQEQAYISSFVISGYGHNRYYHSAYACNNISRFLTSERYPFCSPTSNGFRCEESRQGKGDIDSYSYTLDVNCNYTSGDQTLNTHESFMIYLTPSCSSMMAAGNITGYSTVAVVNVNRCALSRYFYIVFSSVCASITITIFFIRAWMRTCLVGLSFKLSQSESFNWVYEGLEKQGFFNFENPYRNEPYHLVEGEKFYVMRDRRSCTSKDVDGDIVGDTVGYTVGDKVGDTDSLAWSSANSVYKFTYADGKVFAYCKDRCGFETFVETDIESSVACVIKEYLKQKSRSVCVTNDAKSHFLSLTECCELAQDGYELVEEISDGSYRMFYWSPRPQSSRVAQTV